MSAKHCKLWLPTVWFRLTRLAVRQMPAYGLIEAHRWGNYLYWRKRFTADRENGS